MNNLYFGIVENRDDPLNIGRCQVRVFGVHSESLEDVPTSSLPWAIPLTPITSASLSGVGVSPTGLVNGSLVGVMFIDGESKQQPVMIGSLPGIPQNQNSGLKSSVLDESLVLNPTQAQSSTTTPVTTSSGTPLTSGDGTPVSSGSTSTVVGKPAGDWVSSSLARCLALIKKYEGFKASPYKDSVGIPTIGYGTTIYPSGKKVTMSDPDVDQVTALEYIKLHLKNNVFPTLTNKITVNITESMFESLNCFVYNIGAGAFSKSTLLKLLNSKDYKGAEKQFAEWTKAGNQVLTGLVRRRTDEASLFGADGYPDGTKEPTEVSKPTDDSPVNEGQTPTSSSIKDKIVDAESMGFKDPNRKFPLTSLLKEPDTNRIFRRVSKGTLIDKKNQRRRRNIKSADGKTSFSEPRSPYNAKYPYNRGFFTESGHVMEFDDTPGSERVNIHHTAGTFVEIDAFGTQVNKIVGDGYTIIERNGYVYIDGTARIIIGSDVSLAVGGDLAVSVSGSMTYDASGDIKFKTPGNIQFNAGGTTSINSVGNLNMDGAKTYINSGKSTKTSEFVQRTVSKVDYDVLVPESAFDGEVLELEDSPNVETFYKDAIASGKATQAEIDAGKNASASASDDSIPPAKDVIPKSCAMFTSDNIPSSTQISKYFTIGNLSSNAAVSKYQIVAQRGLTVPQIACNLKMVAENCADAIKEKYPNAFITSGFRAGSGTSQHELGQALDIQFSGASKSDYFAIAQWIKDNVMFDQLLLEYKTTGSGMPWIHISYKESPRRQVMTFMNHAKHSMGLSDLSKA